MEQVRIAIAPAPSFVWPEVNHDEDGFPYILIGGEKAELPPHFEGHHLSQSDVINLMLGSALSVPLNVLSGVIYDWLRKKEVVSVTIGGVKLEGTPEAIEAILSRHFHHADSPADP